MTALFLARLSVNGSVVAVFRYGVCFVMKLDLWPFLVYERDVIWFVSSSCLFELTVVSYNRKCFENRIILILSLETSARADKDSVSGM